MAKKNYEKFPLSLALFDALPVLFFCISMILIGVKYKNTVFMIGAVLCTLAGVGKVVWKIIIAGTRKDIVILNRQMRVVMPFGFLCILIGVVMGAAAGKIDTGALMAGILSFPSALFFIITIIGMICMMVFAVKLDSTKLSSNWIEQITNAIAQGCLLLGILSMVR